MDEVKLWVYGLIGGPALGLLLWYFRRSQTQTDERLKDFDRELEGLRIMVGQKAERTDLTPVWEAIHVQAGDIKALGAAFSRELREQMDTLRREQNDHQRQTNDRLDRILTLVARESQR